jgi:predicted Zn-dependent protease
VGDVSASSATCRAKQRLEEIRAKARPAAVRAVELDPSLPEAHLALGSVLWLYDWDWTASSRHLRRALELDPRNATAHLLYGQQRLAAGHFTEAATFTDQALAYEPVSRFINMSALRTYYYTRRFDALISHATATLAGGEGESLPAAVRRTIVHAYLLLGRAGDAAREAETLTGGSAADVEIRATIAAAAGRRDEAVVALDRLREMSLGGYVSPIHVARLACALERGDEALRALEDGCRLRDLDLLFLRVDPRFEVLYDEARFIDLVRRVGIPDAPG